LNAANPWPMGTTNDWKQNGSSAVLDLPEAEVLYAELVWGGSFQYGTEDVTASLGSPVKLEANGQMMMIAPSPMTALTISETAASGFAVRYYMRSADVTNFVKQAGKGTYTVSGVPATQTTETNSLNAAGWTLVVAYRDEGAAIRNLSVFVGGSFVDENTTQDYTISGFCAPPAGEVTGSVVVSTIEGDASFVGDLLQIAPTAAGPFVNLSGPNNPANNFFCSQINDSDGMLDNRGTFGMVNHDAAGGVNTKGGRQGWDVTTVNVSSAQNQLKNGQTSAVIRTLTTDDSFMPVLAAFSIDVNAPDFKGAASSSISAPPLVAQDETFTVTATLANNGQVAAQNVAFTLPIEDTLSLTGFAINGMMGDVNGNAVDAAKLGMGVPVGNLAAGQTKTITVEVKVLAAPKFGSYFFKAKWDYGFEVCVNKPLIPESYSQSTLVQFAGGGSASSSSSGAGGAGSGGAGMGGNNMGGSGGVVETGGAAGQGGTGGGDTGGNGGGTGETATCACDVAGAQHSSTPMLPALGLAALFAARRNRRRTR
jgi:MYXO-CTERM domain-containing protein